MGVYLRPENPAVIPALSARWGVLEPETLGFSVGGYVVGDERLGVCWLAGPGTAPDGVHVESCYWTCGC